METEWRTTTVVALCEAMRESRDYSATPILADALEEAEFGDEKVLALFRGSLPNWQSESLVALVYSDKTNAAVRRIEEIAAWLGPGAIQDRNEYDTSIPMDYQRLMEVAHDWVEGKGGTSQWMGETWRDLFPNRADEFWDQYQIITGRKLPEGDRRSFFACSC